MPSMRFRPSTSTYPRSAIPSACRAFCSTMRIGVPPALILRTTSKISPRNRGESPAVGSSRSSTTGSTMSALAIATICRCPPEREPAGSRRRSARGGKSAYISSIRGRKSSLRM